MTQETPLHVFKIRDKSPLDIKMFLDESGTVDISRSDIVKHTIFEKQAHAMRTVKWEETEINLSRDKIDFYDVLNANEQFIFTSNLKRQMMLDTIQSLGLAEALLPLVSDPMIKRCINIITFFEEVHNITYEHILRNVYNDPSEVNDSIKNIDLIIKCGESISKYYDDLLMETAKYRLNQTTLHDLKKKLWLALQSINALEGIRFFVSFACSFSFGQSGRMIGNSSLIKLIANDELMHVAFTTALIRMLPNDDEEFAVIREECKQEAIHIFMEVVADEKRWATYLFKNGSLLGLNEQMLSAEIDYTAAKRMHSIHLSYPDSAPKSRPLPWMSKWLNEGDMQPAPQETEKTSYVKGIINTLDENTFDEIEL
jgi:ribonucleoside-diphosphate reductase beta chain